LFLLLPLALLARSRAVMVVCCMTSTTLFLAGDRASIAQLNTVRKHLSRVKGGQLAAAAYPAQVVALILSDVIGDPLDVIASGPTVPDTSTYADALAAIHTLGISSLPPRALKRLEVSLYLTSLSHTQLSRSLSHKHTCTHTHTYTHIHFTPPMLRACCTAVASSGILRAQHPTHPPLHFSRPSPLEASE